MKFYDREQEMAFLKETREQAEKVARFTVVTGRRRIGKTTLVREAYSDKPFVYFFVARKILWLSDCLGAGETQRPIYSLK